MLKNTVLAATLAAQASAYPRQLIFDDYQKVNGAYGDGFRVREFEGTDYSVLLKPVGPVPDMFNHIEIADGMTAFLGRAVGESGMQQLHAMATAESGNVWLHQFPDHPGMVLLVAPDDSHMAMSSALLNVDLEEVLPATGHVDVQWRAIEQRTHRQRSEKEAVVDSVDTDEYLQLMEQLTGDVSVTVGGSDPGTYDLVTRQSTTELNLIASQFMLEYFEEHGNCDDIHYFPITVSGVQTRNVCCFRRGASLGDEWVEIGGHMDSISQTPLTLAPGACDDASGTAGAMLAAKALASTTPQRSIEFCGWSGEEQGIIGSSRYVSAAENGDIPNDGHIDHMRKAGSIMMDMISYSSRYYGVTIEGTNDPNIQKLMDLVEDNLSIYSANLTINRSNLSFGSDHVPFQRAGVPCVLLIEEDDTNYPHYHRNTDTVENGLLCPGFQGKGCLNQAVDIVKGMVGASYDLAHPRSE